MQKEIEFICGERHEKSSKEGLVHNSRSDGSVGDSLHIRKHPFKLILLHPPGYDFYMACRTKLGWNQDFDSLQQQD